MQTLRRRIVTSTVAVFLVITAASMLAQYWVVRDALRAAADAAALRKQALLTAALAPLAAERDLAGAGELLQRLVEEGAFAYVEMRDSGGTPLAAAGRVAAAASAQAPGALALYHYDVPLTIDGRRYGEVRFGLRDHLEATAERRLFLGLAGVAVLGVLAAAALQLPLARRLTGGLQSLSEAAERMRGGDFVVRSRPTGRDEIARVGEAFERMSQALAQRVAALEDSEQRQRQLVAALAEGVVFQDADDRVLECNDAACHILGLTRGQLLGTDSMDPRWRAIGHDGEPFDFTQHPSVIALRTGQPVDGVLMGVQRPDGHRAWISINSRPIVASGATRPHATVTSFNDVTVAIDARRALQTANDDLERRVAERTAELAAARDAAEAASRSKSEFLSRMSHELRTPLNAILGFAQVLRARLAPATGEVDEQLRHVEDAGWHLLELINDVLDLARIESGAMAVALERVELAGVVDEARTLVARMASGASVTVRVDPAVRGLAVEADRTRLRQVLVNLLSNACKYNRPGGRVDVVATVRGDSVAIEVRDTGLGLDAGQLARLFEPFNRLGSERGPVEGTGIGLVITRHLAQLMGGSLEVESVVGSGSVFRVVLRAAGRPADDRAAPGPVCETGAAPASAGSQRELLYVEDNEINVELMAAVCAMRPGIVLRVARSAEQALDELRHGLPALMVVDIGLPGIDGFELCRRVRALPGGAALPMVALSANAMEADRQQGVDAGFDRYFTKPMSIKGMLEWIDQSQVTT